MMIEQAASVVRCTECHSGDSVLRKRVIAEWVDLSTNTIVRADVPVWTDEYECRACGLWWIDAGVR